MWGATYISYPFQKTLLVQPMFKNYVGNCRVFWRSFNNMKFAWKGTLEALMVKFEGKIGTLYQIFTPCTHCKFCMMFKRKGGGGSFEQCSKKLHFSLGMASLIDSIKKQKILKYTQHTTKSNKSLKLMQMVHFDAPSRRAKGQMVTLKIIERWPW